MTTSLEKIKDITEGAFGQSAQSRFLVQSIELEETDPPGVLTAATMIISAVVIFAIVWAAVTNVDQVAISDGAVAPAGSIQAVQHLEGGIVEKILVRDGDVVNLGDVLLRLLPTDARAELDQLLARRAAFTLESERHLAIAQDRAPAFDEIIDGYVTLKRNQLALFSTQQDSYASQRDVLLSQLAQQRTDFSRMTKRLESLHADKLLLDEELKTREKLYRDGLTTRLAFLDIQRQHAQSVNEIQETEETILRTLKSIEEAEARLKELKTSTQKENLTAVGEIAGRLAEVNQSVKRAEARAKRLEVVAPTTGIVQGLSVNAINAVIQPGQTLLEVVPTGAELVVEAQVSPRHIGHIKIDQPVDVRITSFDFARFGSIDGVVTRISASTFMNDEGERFYRAIIKLNKHYVGDDPELHFLIPGMTVQANIRTGKKSILDYILKPVYRGFSQSFGER
jgi:HlyD family secretion protein/adhesin transport system membrane fusion protein